MKLDTTTDLDEYLTQIGPVQVYIQEYRLTHSYLHLRVVGKHFRDLKCNVYLFDTLHIAGPPQGGPWQLRAAEIVSRGERVIEIASEAREFVVRALRMSATDYDEPKPAP